MSGTAAEIRELVRRLVDEDGDHGARKRVANRLGIHPTEVTKILSGTRTAGEHLAQRIRRRVACEVAPTPDAELAAMTALVALDDATRARVIAWAAARWPEFAREGSRS